MSRENPNRTPVTRRVSMIELSYDEAILLSLHADAGDPFPYETSVSSLWQMGIGLRSDF